MILATRLFPDGHLFFFPLISRRSYNRVELAGRNIVDTRHIPDPDRPGPIRLVLQVLPHIQIVTILHHRDGMKHSRR